MSSVVVTITYFVTLNDDTSSEDTDFSSNSNWSGLVVLYTRIMRVGKWSIKSDHIASYRDDFCGIIVIILEIGGSDNDLVSNIPSCAIIYCDLSIIDKSSGCEPGPTCFWSSVE